MISPRNHPKALLVISPDCPHCSPVLDALSRMVKDGSLGHLEIINIAIHPEKAEALGARSAPWIRIGRFEFTGQYKEDELRVWASLTATNSGFSAYFSHLLEVRRLDTAVKVVGEYPNSLSELLQLIGDPNTAMSIRIGVGAAIEELQEQGLLYPAIPMLSELTMSDLPQIRADACHYLCLTEKPEALPAVTRLLTDEDSEVREIAAETVAFLNNHR